MSLETLLPELEDATHPLATAHLASLSNLDGVARDQFLTVWRGLSIQRKRDIVDKLADLTEDNVDFDFNDVFLIGLLDDDVQVRVDSVRGLWEYEDRALIGPLLKLLYDHEAIVRAEAALALGRFLLRAELAGEDDERLREVEEALRGTIRDENELADVRGRAIEAVGARSKSWVRDVIENAYEAGDRRLRISAVHAMGRNVDPHWLPVVVEEMESDDAEIRYEAALAAGSIGDQEAISPLAQLTMDDDSEVQEAAIEALGEIGGTSARSVLENLAAETGEQRIIDAVEDALAHADFIDDPLGVRTRVRASEADDLDDEEDA